MTWKSNLLLVTFAFVTSAGLSEAATKPTVHYCHGGRFQPCVCYQDVAKQVEYRPTLAQCRGNAAIITTGKYLNVFSVVVRDSDNRDRWPANGVNGCSSKLANSKNPPNKCSVFKVQKTIFQGAGSTRKRINCLGASGSSKYFKEVVRMTAKLADVPGSSADPLARWCLKSPILPLN